MWLPKAVVPGYLTAGQLFSHSYVFNSLKFRRLYVDSLVKGIDSTHKSYKNKEEAIEDFLKMKGMGLVKQIGIYQADLFPNAPIDLSAE